MGSRRLAQATCLQPDMGYDRSVTAVLHALPSPLGSAVAPSILCRAQAGRALWRVEFANAPRKGAPRRA